LPIIAALSDPGIGALGRWGDGAKKQTQNPNHPMQKHHFLESLKAGSLTLNLTRMGHRPPVGLRKKNQVTYNEVTKICHSGIMHL